MFSKMWRRKRSEDDEGTWELPTSMIDVVFLLLIFFMCASKFRVLEERLDTFLPNRGPGRGPVRHEVEPIAIKVSTQGRSRRIPVFRVYGWTCHDANELAARLLRLPRPAKYEVQIDGEGNCPFQHIMSAVDACARADLTKVSFRPPPTRS